MPYYRSLPLLASIWILALSAACARPGGGPGGVKTDLGDYIWPTDASRSLTSSFAEYRTSHFHGGIDISTHGQTGYKVFASRDGYVYRIRITPDGYGKMLYLKHRDGYATVYAHLKTFNDEINRIVRAEQYRRGTYAIDLTPDSASHPVTKGEVVAYTGDTGFGPPHLHFEIRDEHLDPINPMLCASFGNEDRLPPVIKRLLVSPLNYNSTIDNGTGGKIIRRFGRKAHALTVPQRLLLHGEIGFAVEAVDLSEGTWSRAGIYKLEFYIDDSLAFSKALDRVPADETKEIDLDYDLPMILQGWGKFQKMYIDTGNSLPFYGGRPEGTGIIRTDRLSEGSHSYRIVCSDFHANRTTLGGTIIVNHRPTIKVAGVDNDGIVLTGTGLGLIDKFHVGGRKLGAATWSEHTLPRGRFEEDGTGIELPVDTRKYDILRISAETRLGSQTPPVFTVLHKPKGAAQTVNLKTEVAGDFVRCTVSTAGLFSSPPRVTVQEGASVTAVDMQATDPGKYSGAFVPADNVEGTRSVTVRSDVNGHETSAADELTVFPLPSRRGGSFTAAALGLPGLQFAYDSGAVFRPFLMQITTDSYNHSTVYILEPQDRLLNGGIRVTVPAGPSGGRGHRGLFFRSNGGWIFRTDLPDSGSGSFSTTLTRTLGELAVLPDDEPPSFGRLRVSAPGGRTSVRFHYHDNLSGVDTDELKMFIDGRPVIPEIDGEHHLAFYQSDKTDTRLDRGRHTLKITMKDRMKNESEISRTFSVR